ncbi:hypothetical protein QN382_23000 [Pseudomonas sp. 10B1]|uniref:hypothetical protein n=1 Tax=unclassified Pseudomonas TaxID=196821 RepID=UPI002B2305E9|nr:MULTISPECIES: hypothetical protein [unclassified Pseudomonas]MEA9997059.1 hypothetical protein [Pseudomonas sp. AA4]MEB0089249.1 hypothetical protein [Pseudomonas sp. RTI1]MEB0128441.1 hypothetical protein [Pseudomonas sp. CCC1.2]MEB0155339.1 hypothetical protein [Pseudomonas sp. CCC4.3]MEB0221707.1 hypothetical protein [Pseudomonas sp. AB12(2023)]
MNMRTKLSAAMPFAHFFGLTSSAEEKDDDEDKKAKRAKRADADEKDDEKDKEGNARGAKAEDDGDDELEDDDDDKKARKAKRRGADGDDDMEDGDDDDKPKGNRATVAGERARCAQIVAHGIKSGNVEQACVFAFDTSMSAASAVNALTAAGAVSGQRGGLRDRMATVTTTHVGAEGGGQAPAGMSPMAQKIIAAAERAQAR